MKYSKIKQIILEEIALLKESAKMLRLNGVEPALIDALKKIDEKQILAWFYILINSHPETPKEEIVIKKETIAQLNQQSLLQFLKQNTNKINHIKEWLSNNKSINIRQLAEKKETIDDLYKKAEIWHKTTTETNPSEIDGKKVLKTYKENGSVLVWVDLQTNSCREESKAMGHCGTDTKATTLFSLRSIQGTNIEPHVTIAWNQDKQAVTQVKGKENKPPVPKYMKYVWDFLKFLKAQNPKFRFIWSHKYDLSLKDVGENLGVMKCSQIQAKDIVWKTTSPEPTLYYEGEQKELTEEVLNSIKSDSQRAIIINGKYNTNYKYVLEFKNGVALAEISNTEATFINLKGEDIIDSVELTEELLNSIEYNSDRASIINRKYNTNYKYVEEFKNGIAVAEINDNEYTVINLKGQDVIESIELTEELLNSLKKYSQRTMIINRKYNTNYKYVEEFKNGIAVAEINDNEYTVINLKGQDVIESIELTEESLNSLKDDYQRAALINRKYNTNYSKVEEFKNGIAVAEINDNEYTVINLKGQDVIESIELTEELLNSLYTNYQRASLINRKYNTNYKIVRKFKNGIADATTEDGKEIKINLKGEIVNTLNEQTIQKWIRYMNYFESR